tara:strand:+ start:184 stop:357 length:174 start_codon:yes stop_codon:yes gene_type:complete
MGTASNPIVVINYLGMISLGVAVASFFSLFMWGEKKPKPTFAEKMAMKLEEQEDKQS